MRMTRPTGSGIVSRFLLVAAAILITAPASAAVWSQFYTRPDGWSFGPWTEVISFGDSLADSGNLWDLTQGLTGGPLPPSPPNYMRFTNGLVWPERLATDLGIPLTNYAVGGARTNDTNVNDPRVVPMGDFPGLQDQINMFAASLGGGPPDPNALYTMVIGANDFLPPPADAAEGAAIVTAGVTNVITAAVTLQTLGVQNLVIFGLPDLGLTPLAVQSGFSTLGTLAATLWNSNLVSGLDAQGVEYLWIDAAGLTNYLVANPDEFGFTNVTDACVSTPGCIGPPYDKSVDPDTFLFWDDFHPTRHTHDVISNLVFEAVIPVPAAIFLFPSALLVLGWMRRRVA